MKFKSSMYHSAGYHVVWTAFLPKLDAHQLSTEPLLQAKQDGSQASGSYGEGASCRPRRQVTQSNSISLYEDFSFLCLYIRESSCYFIRKAVHVLKSHVANRLHGFPHQWQTLLIMQTMSLMIRQPRAPKSPSAHGSELSHQRTLICPVSL